jgi:hypothetical protein
LLTLLAGTAGLAVSVPAQATDYLPGTNTPTASFLVPGDPFNGPVSATYGLSGLPAGTFTDRFLIPLGQNGRGSGSITANFSGDPGIPPISTLCR